MWTGKLTNDTLLKTRDIVKILNWTNMDYQYNIIIFRLKIWMNDNLRDFHGVRRQLIILAFEIVLE